MCLRLNNFATVGYIGVDLGIGIDERTIALAECLRRLFSLDINVATKGLNLSDLSGTFFLGSTECLQHELMGIALF